jgi:hypothetical protein
VVGLLQSKPRWQLILGHYLALVGIPLEGTFLLMHSYMGIKPIGKSLSRVFLYTGLILVSLGTAYHATFGFAGEVLQWGDKPLINRLLVYFEPFGVAFTVVLVTWLVYWSGLILSGKTHYPRWVTAISPLSFLLVSTLIANILPPAARGIRVFITVTGFNLPMVIWGGFSTIILWDSDLDPKGHQELLDARVTQHEHGC